MIYYSIDSTIVISNVDYAHLADNTNLENYGDYLEIYIDSTRYDFLIGKKVRVFSKPYTVAMKFCNDILSESEFIDIEYNGQIYSVLNGRQTIFKKQ